VRSLTFETLGNATIQFMADGEPLLATDPWLSGTCYFGSWALDHPLTDRQISNIRNSRYIWISHGHPDHLHSPSLELIPRTTKILLPDHYTKDIYHYLVDLGFGVIVLQYRRWTRLDSELEILCIDNENQDAILVARFGPALVINLNDSPLCGEQRFLRKLIQCHPNDRVFILKLCAVDADMRNFMDPAGRRVTPAPDELKPGTIREVARGAHRLGAKFFCCSSSQHLYVRADALWANEYRIAFSEIQRLWNQPKVELIPPFVTVDLLAGIYTENHPSHMPDLSQITSETGGDDWQEALELAEQAKIRTFFQNFSLLRRYLDFIEVVVAGERVRVEYSRRLKGLRRAARGVTFFVPRRSLLEAVTSGYFDDLLIGNFMKTQLHGDASLYPFVTPIIAKIGGNAHVYAMGDYLQFCWRYFRRNPAAFIKWRTQRWSQYRLLPWARKWAERLGKFQAMKRFYRERLLKDLPHDEDKSPPSTLLYRSGPRAVWLPARTRQGKWAPARPELLTSESPRLIVSVDTEEDFDWDGDFSPAVASVESIARQELAQRVIEQHGATPIYLCDFPVASQEKGYKIFREWQQAGRCEIGAHLHPWVNPPQREQVNRTNSYPCNLPLQLQQDKLRILTETITDNIGVRPSVYKAGRYGGDFRLPMLLKPLGYRVDMSINPIGDYSADGGPNLTMFPHEPFWLDPERELLAIPATGNVLGSLRGHWTSLAGAIHKETGDRFKLGWLLRRFGLINRVFLSPEGTPLDEAKALTRFLVDAGHRVFTLDYHSTSLNPGSNPYVRNDADLRRFLDWLDAYLEFFFDELGGIPTSPAAVFDEARTRPVTLAALP
jgi:hypothetical protein